MQINLLSAQGLIPLCEAISHTHSVERLLKIAYKAIQFSNIVRTETTLPLLTTQLKHSIETLGAIQVVLPVIQLASPSEKMSWQKTASQLFLLAYSLLFNISLAEKLKIVDWGKRDIEPLANASYACYHLFTAFEEGRKRVWFKVALSIGKLFVLVCGSVLDNRRMTKGPFLISITGLSIILDGLSLKVN